MARKKPKSKPTGTNARKRGGQPQNKNALKHGYYARLFTPTERADLDTDLARIASLDGELSLLRVSLRRVYKFLKATESLDGAVSTMGALGAGAGRVASLLKTRKFLAAEVGSALGLLEQLLQEVIEEKEKEQST